MDLDDAFRIATKKFYEGQQYSKLEEASGKKMKYTKEALDEIEKYVRKKVDTSSAEEAKQEILQEEQGEE